MERKVTVPDLQRMKEAGAKITALTAYDYSFGRIVDAAGIDVILVGDSLGMVVQGLETTLPVTLEETIYHCRMVARARRRALLVADLPFLTYQVSVQDALRNAGLLIKEGGAEAVKLEGVAIHLYRVMQEALNNIARHSKSPRAAVRLSFLPETVVLEVEDEGVGFGNRRKQGMGLVSMRERAEMVHGRVEFLDREGGGALVRLTVPA